MPRRLLSNGAAVLPATSLPNSPARAAQAPRLAGARPLGPALARRNAPNKRAALQALLEAGVIWCADAGKPRKGSLVAQSAIETSELAEMAQPEGPEPGAEGMRPSAHSPAPAPVCVLVCLYAARRCPVPCAGCKAAAARGPACGDARHAAAAPAIDAPPSNTGANKGGGHDDN